METTSTASNESFEYAKAEIAKEILKLKNRLDVITELSNAITENSSLYSIKYLIWVASINVKSSECIMNDIKILTDSVGK